MFGFMVPHLNAIPNISKPFHTLLAYTPVLAKTVNAILRTEQSRSTKMQRGKLSKTLSETSDIRVLTEKESTKMVG